MTIINDGNEYRLPDFFLNDDVQFSYQIEKPLSLSVNDYLISAEFHLISGGSIHLKMIAVNN